MARYSASFRAAGAGSATLPIGSVYAATGSGGTIREVGVFNSTATAVVIALVRLDSAGTQGAGITEALYAEYLRAPACTAFNTHSAGPTIGEELRRASLGAAIGSGVIWTFGDTGIVIPAGTANGIGIYIPTGTGQVCDLYFDWDE